MSKKLITACMALFALAAFALPAGASASPELTHPTGTTVAVGTKITATNIGETTLKDTSNNILARCTSAVMTGELTKNNGNEIEGDITTATFKGTGSQDPAEAANMPECTGTFGNITVTTNGGGVDGENVEHGTPWCIKASEVGKFTLRGGLCSQASRTITFILKSTTVGECKYSRTEPVKGTNTTDTTGDAILSVTAGADTEFTKEAGGIFCPSVGTLEMSFTLETDTAAVSPMYIS